MPEPVADGAYINALPVMDGGEGAPEFVQRPFLADRMLRAAHRLLLLLAVAVTAVEPGAQSQIFQLSEKVAFRVAVRAGKNPAAC